jgi:carboxypeptidase D
MVSPQRRDVVRALHATGKSESWMECRGRVQQEFNDHKSPSSIELIPKILQRIPILLFAGDQDFICNYMGIESMIQAMTWNGGTGLGVSPFGFWPHRNRGMIRLGLQTVKTQVYSVEGSPAGTWVSSRNLTYVKVSRTLST